jgi:hypothetical protein
MDKDLINSLKRYNVLVLMHKDCFSVYTVLCVQNPEETLGVCLWRCEIDCDDNQQVSATPKVKVKLPEL